MRNNKRNVSIRHTTTLFMLLAMALHGYAQLAHAKHAEGKNHQHAGHDDLDGLLNLHDQEIHFMENKGQFSEPVLYRADLPMGQAIATKGGMVVTAFDPVSLAQFQQDGIAFEKEIQDGLPHRVPVWNKKGHSWKLNFTGSSPNMKVESRNSHEGISNYFMGDVSAMDVNSYQEVWYTNTYRGIDVRYYPAEDGSLEYDIICKPGSEPKQVAIEFEGIDQISVNQKGELVINTSLGEFTYPAPVVYQRVNGKESSVRAAYVVEGKNTLRFELGAYDKNETLVIDPIALRWATWMNTNSGSDNHGHCIWVDPTDGAIYVVARVSNGTDQITPGAFDETANGSYDMVVGKYLEPTTIGQSGTRVWQTYIGGNGIENPYAMEQGADGNLYITGYTASTNFPLLGGPAFSGSSVNQQSQSGDNVYIVKINTGGNSIKSAVVGGNGDENAFDLRIATNGDVIVGGNSVSTNLATSNNGSGATNGNSGGNDVLIFRINGDLSAVQWMRNYGGSSNDLAQIMLYEPTTGDIFVGGRTTSTNFPTLNPRQSTRGGNEAGFLQRISGAGTTLWSSYFQAASSKSLTILCMSMNTTGSEIYFGGVTSGLATSNISSSGVYDNSYNGGTNDLFVARMGLDQSFIGSTYVGGSSNEVNMMGLNTDLNNDVYVFGYTNSTNFPVSSGANVPLQATNNGSNDKVFLKLSADLSNLDFSTYYGGSGDDYDPVGERGIKFSNCRIYTIVTAKSNNIPLTQGALNTTKYSSDYEPGVVVWANPPDLLGNTITGNQSVCAGSVPGDITGSEPAYSLPTIVRNNSTSSYPSLGSAATYQWQISSDSLNWNDISGATAKDLPGSMIGTVNEKTYIRRIIGGDACILAGAADQVVTVKLIEATATITHVSCNGANDGAITASSTGVGPFTYVWSHGPTGATINGLAAGAYTVEVTDANGCHASKTFNVTQPAVLGGLINGVNATCNNSDGSATTNISGGTTPYTYLWSNGSTGSSVNSLSAGTHSVQVTDAHGCVLSLSVTIGSSGTPDANAGADKVITCLSGSQVTLNGSSQTGGVSYAWTATSGGHIVSGANTATPTVDAAGTYTLLVTNTQTGCSSTDQAMVTMNTAAPNSSASASGTLTCTVTSVSLNGGSTTSGASFSWTGPGGFTSTDEDPTVSAPGNYVLTVTDPTNGCTNTATATVGQDINVPVATATGGTLTCAVTSVTLQGAGNGTYSWSGPGGFTSNDQNPTVSAPGSYVLTVTGTNGCTNTATATVGQDIDVPVATATGGTLTCAVTSVTLQGAGNGTYSWSGPSGFTSNDQNPTVSAPGSYVLTVTGTNGCTNTATATVGQDIDVPVATATGGTLTCAVTSVTLQGAGNGTYSWSGPSGFTSNDQNPTVSAPGSYVLTVTGTNGCTNTATATVDRDSTVPGAQAAGGTLSCAVTSIMLQGTGNGTYSWSGPGGFTSNDQNPTVSAPGSYVLTVTGTNGCTNTATATVGQDIDVPVATATGGTLTCAVTSVTLQGAGNGTYSWSGPGGFTSNDQNPTVSAPGSYVLTVTGTNGCTNTATATVGQDIDVPVATATGGTLTCAVTSVTLQGAGNGTYSWSGPGGFTSNDQNPTVSAPGSYVLTVTGTNGCTNTATATVGQDIDVPVATATGGTLTCAVTSVTLQGAGNGTYSWSGPGGFTSNDQNPTVSAPGSYVLTVTGTNGCTNTATATVGQDIDVPVATATGGTLTCAVTSVTLQGAGNGTYSWSGPGGFTSNDQNPTVSAPGSYVLTVTGTNGCTNTATATVGQDIDVPVAAATGGTLTCAVTSVTLQGAGNGTYSWSGPGGFTSNDQNPTVSAAGTYTLLVTGSNGCTSTASAQVNLDDQTPGATAQGGTLNCNISEIILQGTGNGTYSWSGPAGFTSNDQNPTVSAAGTYTLLVTGSNGCTSTASAQVNLDDQTPGATAQGGTLNCNISEIILQGTGNGTYSWSGPAGFTSNDQNPTVSAAGTYTLLVTGSNGCTSTASAQVNLDDQTPGATAQGGTLNCNISEITLQGTGNGTYSWSGPAGFTSNDQNPTVSAAGTYTLLVTGSNGCTSTASAQVNLDDQTPGATAEGGVLNCSVSSIMLHGTGNGTYAWSGPNGFTSTEQNPSVGAAGTYTLVVTGANGCTSIATAQVEQDAEVPGATAQGGTLNCNISEIMLVATGNGTYSWTGPNGFISTEQNPVVTEAGTYVLTVTGANGCTSTANATVNLDNTLPGALAAGGTLNCNISEITLQGTGNGTYSWSGPAGFTSNDQNPTVSAAGTYTLLVTGSNGCTSTASAQVNLDDQTPGATAEGGVLNCSVSSIMLHGTGNGTYAWSGPNGFTSTEQNPSVGAAGTYTLVVTGANGCTSIATAQVEQDAEVPGATAQGGTLNCNISEIMLVATGNGTYSWTGPNGFISTEQNPVVTEAGTYVLTVTGANGCTSTANATVNLDNTLPGALAAGGTLNCNISEITLQGTGNGTYSWSGPAGFTSNDQNPTVSAAGTYTLLVTGSNGCTSTASAQVNLDDQTPGATAEGGVLNCSVSSIMLHGTGNGTYAWSGPNGFTSTEQNPSVGAAGTYTLVVTGANGCTSTATAQVEQDAEVPGATAQGGTLNCNISEIMLLATGNGTYSWTGPNGFISTEQNPVVTEVGTYVLTVTGANGCTSTANATVNLDNTLPGAQAAGGTLNCSISEITLQGTGNGTYSWSGPAGFTSNDQNPTVSAPGSYTLLVTGSNGCTSTATADVEQDSTVPGAQAFGGTLTCAATSVTLQGVGNGTFAWTGPNGFSSTMQNVTVTEVGTYTLTVMGANGCTSTADAIVDQNITAPGAQATGGMLDCTTHTAVLHGYGNGTFAWSGPNGFSSTMQNPEVADAGTYTLVVTGANGCTSTATASVLPEECGGCEAPIIISCAPAVTTVECDASIDPEDIGFPILRKDTECPLVNYFNYYDEFSGICPITVIRHWTFRDEAGNEETCTQTILIVDTQAPVLMNVPEDVTVICSDVPEVPKNVWASDCKNTVDVEVNDVLIAGPDESTYTIERTFTATDACGNTASATQVISVVGCKTACETPIIISCAPAETTVECGTSIDPEDIGLPVTRKSPDCPEVNFFTYEDLISGTCPVTVKRTWTISDADGNAENCVQMIYIVDTEAPMLSCMDYEVTVDCDAIPEAEKCSATDNCDSDMEVFMTEETGKGDCESGYTITRTYTAADACGNTATTVQIIHVISGGNAPKAMQTPVIDPAPITHVQVAPNPFRKHSTISFTSEVSGRATVVLMDMLGHQVATLMDKDVEKGAKINLEFKPESESGALFFYRITLNNYHTTGKIMYRP